MIIKPAVGGNLLIQDRAGGAVLSTGTSGAAIASGVTGGAGLSGMTSLGTVTAGNLSNSAIVYPAGHIIQTKIGSRTSAIVLSNTDYQTVGISVTITPLYSNSKMLITLWGTTSMNNSSTNTGHDHKITRTAGTSESVSGSEAFRASWLNYMNRSMGAADHYPAMHVCHADSGFPNEQITYGMFARKYGGSASSQNWTFGEGNGGTQGGMLMVQEIKQ
jgi:hypothetical protein